MFIISLWLSVVISREGKKTSFNSQSQSTYYLTDIIKMDYCINNFLLTEREGRTGEYWPEVVAVRTERSEVRTKTTEGQYSPVRLELARLVSSLLYGFLITFCFVFASP